MRIDGHSRLKSNSDGALCVRLLEFPKLVMDSYCRPLGAGPNEHQFLSSEGTEN